MVKSSVLIVSHSQLKSDPRVQRQIEWLKEGFHISSAGYSAAGSEHDYIQLKPVRFCPIQKALFSFFASLGFHSSAIKYFPVYVDELQLFRRLPDYDLVILNDLVSLPAAFECWPKAKIVFDSHEYYPGQFLGLKYTLLFNPFFKWIARNYLPRVDLFFTVADGIGKEYQRLGAPKAELLLNAPYISGNIEQEVGPGQTIRLVHHGGAQSLRKLELMIEMMDYLDERFELTLMLMPTEPEYLSRLKRMADRNPRIHFAEPVEFSKILSELSQYDIGVFLLPPTTMNYKHALPNKFFEFMHAGLAIAIGPSPEMKRILQGTQAGVISDSFAPKDLAEKLNALTFEDVQGMKVRSLELASQYNAQVEGEKFKTHINNLLQ